MIVPIVETSTQKLVGGTEISIPFGVSFELAGFWWTLNFVGKDAFYVQKVDEPIATTLIRKMMENEHQKPSR